MNTAYDYKSESFAFVVSVINELLEWIMIVVHVLSLAIPPWVGVMSTGDGYGHC